MTDKKSGSDRNHRDAGTGQWVTPRFADKHPKTTVSEPRPSTGKGGGKKK